MGMLTQFTEHNLVHKKKGLLSHLPGESQFPLFWNIK